MATFRFTILLVAVVVVAAGWLSCDAAMAKTADAICKENYDKAYCITLLNPIIKDTSVFKGNKWLVHARDKIIAVAVSVNEKFNNVAASSPDHKLATDCATKFLNSVTAINSGKYDAAAQNQLDCSDELEDSSFGDLKALANEAAKGTRVLQDLFAHYKYTQA